MPQLDRTSWPYMLLVALMVLGIVGALAWGLDRSDAREVEAMRACIEQGRHPLECEEAIER